MSCVFFKKKILYSRTTSEQSVALLVFFLFVFFSCSIIKLAYTQIKERKRGCVDCPTDYLVLGCGALIEKI